MHRSSGVEALALPRLRPPAWVPGHQALWIVSRQLTRFISLPLPATLARRKRAAAAALQLRTLSPFAQTESFISLAGSRAQVWFWDAQVVATAAQALGLDPADLWCVPEGAMVAPPAVDGVRLLQVADGVEAQAWKGGVLTASQFWAALPQPFEWASFVRQLGPEGATLDRERTPAARCEPRLALPRAANEAPRPARAAGRAPLERTAYLAGAAFFAVWASWQAGAWIKAETESRRIAAELERLDAQASPLLEARRAAMDDLRFIEQGLSIARYPEPRAVLAALMGALPSEGVSVSDLDLRDGTLRARLVAATPNPPISEMVDQLNRSGVLRNAKAATELGGRTVNVTADLKLERGA
ncbi:MAG: hypothetical protein ACK50B_10275 [Betaproteobacteria bacterium]|nr:hypothetical protein [Burkholderiales bacterium]MCE2644481.1 hypothetical protein [Burkholderiaceae bacterium]